MGIFDDKKFEELDWISQATEPVKSRINDILESLPEEIIIDFKSISQAMVSRGSTNFDQLAKYNFINFNYSYLHWKEESILVDCFKFKLTGNIVLDFENNTINGGHISLVKIKNMIDDATLLSIMGTHGLDIIQSTGFSDDCQSRMNDILELVGKLDDALRSKSNAKKEQLLRRRLHEIFRKDEWKIRDLELATKICTWITRYIKNGDLSAYTNFCKLKVMTHKDQAIYSIEEVL